MGLTRHYSQKVEHISNEGKSSANWIAALFGARYPRLSFSIVYPVFVIVSQTMSPRGYAQVSVSLYTLNICSSCRISRPFSLPLAFEPIFHPRFLVLTMSLGALANFPGHSH